MKNTIEFPKEMSFHYDKYSSPTHVNTELDWFSANSKEYKRLHALVLDPFTQNSPKVKRYKKEGSGANFARYTLIE